MRANLEAVVGCHVATFAEFAGVPREVLYDRMKTVVLGEDDEGEDRYHPTLLDVAAHYGFRPRVCAAYRAKTKGKVERPFRYVREDFFLASQFDNLMHLNAEFDRWRIEVANRRQHGTTRRVVEDLHGGTWAAAAAAGAPVHDRVAHAAAPVARWDGQRRGQRVLGARHAHAAGHRGPSARRGVAPV